MKKITALLCIVALAFASCICISAAEGLAFNDQTFMYAVEDALPAEPVTVEAKIRIPSGAMRGSFFGNYHWDETTNTIDFGIGEYGNPVIRLRDDANVYEYYFSTGTVPYDTWVHLTLVRDVANRKAYCYINGNLTQTVDMTHSYNPLANWDYKIGANNAYMNPDYFKGDIMSLAVYSDVRTADEIKRDAMFSPEASNLMISYDFSNASERPATVADKSGNGNDAIRNRMFFDGGDVPADKYAYTFAVVGDTQNMAKSYSEHFNDIYNYIYDNIDAMNIEAVIGVGDITDTKNFGSIKSEWNVALEGLKIIDDATLSIPIIGNHDNTYWYNKTIGELNYADLVTKYQPHDLRNAYLTKEIGGVPYLFVQLEHGPSDSVLEWANEVVAAHPSHNVIVTTHGYSYHDGTTLDEGDAHNSMTNMGEAIWEKFVSKHSNIVLVLSGHVGHDYAVVNQRKGVNGNTVTEMLIDFQSCDNAAHNYGLSEYGVGVVTLFHFSADGKTVTVENYSTVLEKHFMDLNQFTLQLDTANDATYVKPDRDPLPPREEVDDEPFVEEEPVVIYRNDFSNSNTISDFTQYRAKWEIKNGGLYMTKNVIGGASSANYGHIVYNGGHELENYMIDVDFYNVCTQSGVIFRTFEETLSHEQNGFNGYYALTSNDMTLGAIGSAVNNKWVDVLLDKGAANEDMYVGVNLHFNVVVNNDMITVKMTNIDTGKLVYHGIYALGSNANDPSYVMGSFGFRMRASYSGNTAANNSYFDNLVVTSIPQKKAGPVVPVDTSDRLVVYENNFDDASALGDFAQYYGTWEVKDGRLYLTALSKTASLLVYNKGDLEDVKNYVVDVDMNNIQSQGGLIIRSSSEHITGTRNGNDFYGYAALIAKDGQKGALSYGMPSGDWGGNFDTSGYITYPGSNVHLQVAVLDDVITYRITAPDGMLLWEYTSQADFWTDGTFGFRLSNYTNYWGGGNVNTVSFDNLVVAELNHECTFGEWEIRKPATFTEEGQYSRTCKRCGAEETKPIPKLEGLGIDVILEAAPVTAGDNATVIIKVKSDVAFSSFSIIMPYDKSVTTLKTIDKSNLPSGFSTPTVTVANRTGKITLTYTGSTPYSGEFSLAVTFTTKASFEDSSVDFAISSSSASYTHEQGDVINAEFNIANATLQIVGQELPKGDIDKDGTVGINDVKAVVNAAITGTYSEEIDFNGDGKISLLDIIFVVKQSIK